MVPESGGFIYKIEPSRKHDLLTAECQCKEVFGVLHSDAQVLSKLKDIQTYTKNWGEIRWKLLSNELHHGKEIMGYSFLQII